MRIGRTFAAVGVLTAALSIAACASDDATTRSTAVAATTQPQAANPTSMSDAQLREYLAARAEIEPLQENFGSLTSEQQMQRAQQIADIQRRHNITPSQYNAIQSSTVSDRTFAARLAALAPDTFADSNLRTFAAASVEIDPITQSLSTATPEQQAQATEQIRQILDRNNLDSTTYNAIAARAQAEPAFAQRIQMLYREDTSANGE